MAQWTEKIVSSNARGPLQIVVGDIDNDGNMDVLNVNNYPAQNFVWYRNTDGLGNFGIGLEIGVIYEPRNIAVGDIDGDNDLDVLGTSPYSIPPNLVSYKNLDGLGDFGTGTLIATPNTNGERAILVRDIDGDGHNDLVVGSIDDDSLTWYKNLDGNGNFDTGNIIISGYVNGSGIDVGDIDGDGDLDIVAGTLNYNIMSWFENLDGEGTFGPPREIGSSGMAVLSVFLADIDGDGDLDVIGSAVGAGVFAWWENLDGLGNYGLEKIINNTLITTYIYPVDLDNDDDIDVLALAPGFLRWYENLDGLGNFGEANVIKDDLEFAITVTAADLDNDGDMDPITASQRDNTVYWFENQLLAIPNFGLQNIEIYPNPTQSLVYINSKTENIVSATIFDILGKKVLQLNGKIQQVDFSTLEKGMYFLRLKTDRGEFVQKIIKE
ncbi:T9SS type A sorting domain-containing protein [Aequorivita sp. SDUM287046]|uniref:T9SS type A sorting domain-containing protein n=1 Tax=Aequorivita aurantiaca TaxID=3053356 RepID=A0ABT8DE07_9FLAO|nr:T9SS type A sorting domain-containing protein [Aequorivita aurantiaca]MDN3722998.1 T9SS type A sorting domain-containing protein [Aequorivita aurantiaca]